MSRRSAQSHAKELLRDLNDPLRLRHNVLASKFHQQGVDVREALERALVLLPEQLRLIIIRGELMRELHSTIASELGITTRHFYRLKRRAIELLTVALEGIDVHPSTFVSQADPIEGCTAYADMLRTIGRFDESIALLDELYRSMGDTAQRARLACDIGHLCCDFDRPGLATKYIQEATALSSNVRVSGDTTEILDAEIATANVKLAWSCRNFESVQKNATLASLRLQPLIYSGERDRAAKALVSVLLVEVNLGLDRAAFGDALVTALEAHALLERFRISAAELQLPCLSAVASLRALMVNGFPRAIDDMESALAVAQSRSAPRVAALVSGDLCNALVICGETDRGLTLGNCALTLARASCTPEEFVRCFLAVANAYLILKDWRTAQTLVSQARSRVPAGDAYLLAMVGLVNADVLLSRGRYENALATARASREIIETQGLKRFLGSVLRIEAEAQEGLGEHRTAIEAIGRSLKVLEACGNPYTLARAYRCSGTIRRKNSHMLLADDLVRSLRT